MIEEPFHRDDEDRPLSAHWDDIIGATVMMRDAYREIRGVTELDLIDAWRISQLGSALPWWFVLGKGEPAPAYAAALAKAMQGVGLSAQLDFVKMQTEQRPPLPPLTADSLLALSEANGAGPDKMLLRFFDAMVGTTGADAAASPRLATLIAERDTMLGFAAHYVGFKLALWIHHLARRFVHADIVAALGPQLDERSVQEAIARVHGGDVQVARDAELREIVAGLRALIDAPCEPPDFVALGPADLAGTPPAARHAWLRSLAAHIVPCSPDLRDVDLRASANDIATALESPASESAAVSFDDLAVEVDRVTGCGASAAGTVANALGTAARLDALLGELAARVEAGFRHASGTSSEAVGPVAADARDRLLGSPPRSLLTRLAPRGFVALCRP